MAEEQAAAPAEATKPASVVVDDFSDGNFTHNPPWAVQSGSFEVRNGELVFGTEKDAAIHLDLGKVAWKTPLKARLKLRQTNASGKTSFLFGLALTDTGSGRTQEISASPNPGYFGTSGFYDGATVGVQGAMLNGDTAPQTLEIAFDPAANSVTLRKDGVEVFRGSNRMEMSRVNRLTLKSGGTLTWLVDDVRVEFTPEDPTSGQSSGQQGCADDLHGRCAAHRQEWPAAHAVRSGSVVSAVGDLGKSDRRDLGHSLRLEGAHGGRLQYDVALGRQGAGRRAGARPGCRVAGDLDACGPGRRARQDQGSSEPAGKCLDG